MKKWKFFEKYVEKNFLGIFWAAYSVWIPPNESLDKTASDKTDFKILDSR